MFTQKLIITVALSAALLTAGSPAAQASGPGSR
jgi:hypothetical protein